MRPVSEIATDGGPIDVVLADIDDTMTRDGKLLSEAFEALWRLARDGLVVVPVTGRPAGWCDLIVRQWPVSAVIGENGAFSLMLRDGRVEERLHPRADRARSREGLAAVEREVLARVPGSRIARDQFSRIFDLAIDFCEDPPRLPMSEAKRIKEICEGLGARAKISSIHVNAWFGDYDKRDMARILLSDVFGLELDRSSDNMRVAYCGDSPNDEPMFEAVHRSCAVANISAFEGMLSTPPRFVTKRSHGEGFAEFAQAVLESRR